MAAVAAMQEVDADWRCCRVGAKVEDVRQLEAQHVLDEGQGRVKVRGRQHGVAQAHVAGDKARHALRRNEWQAVGTVPPAQLVAVAGGVQHTDQCLNATLLDLGGSACFPAHAVLLQGLQGGVERALAGQLPARGQVARVGTFDDEHAKRPLVHLHVQSATGRGQYHHAQYVFGITLPLTEVFDLSDEVAQPPNIHHALLLNDWTFVGLHCAEGGPGAHRPLRLSS
ncbi:hypothetical protein D3C79_782480 [compost metagenome]